MKDDLFVGVTTWDSELFLEHCLRSIHNTTQGLSIRIGVVDNFSTDRSVENCTGPGCGSSHGALQSGDCPEPAPLHVYGEAYTSYPLRRDSAFSRLVCDLQRTPYRTYRAGSSGRHWLRALDQALRRGHAGKLLLAV